MLSQARATADCRGVGGIEVPVDQPDESLVNHAGGPQRPDAMHAVDRREIVDGDVVVDERQQLAGGRLDTGVAGGSQPECHGVHRYTAPSGSR